MSRARPSPDRSPDLDSRSLRSGSRAASRILAALVLAVGLAGVAPEARATSILFEAQDLDDGGGTGDLWRIEYRVDGLAVGPGHRLSIRFAPESAAALVDLTGAVAGWDLLVLQPEPLLGSDGRYERVLLGGASFPAVFAVQLVWLGPGAPGPQAFDVFDPAFAVVETGFTVPVPEPGTLLLVGGPLLLLAGAGRRGCR